MLDLGRPEPIVSELLEEACSDTAIRHGYFTRIGGTSGGIYRGLNVGLGSGDDRDDVLENRARVCRWFRLPEDRLATLHQVHSRDVVVLDAPPEETRPKADALVTATPGLVLGVLTADCGPILFADAEAGVIGKPDPTAGEMVKAFVALKPGFEANEELRRELLGHARKHLGPAVAPKEIEFRENLPKTRSGKIMRRLLKARELGLPEGDISTLESDEK